MKVIELLNKIANEEETPNEIKFCNHIFKKGYNNRYDSEEDNLLEFICFDFSNINKEIEIIEEPKKTNKIEKLSLCFGKVKDYEEIEMYDRKTINKIIDTIEQLKREME